MKKILIIFGTRPEAIKMSPVADLINKNANFELKVCVSAQHRQMLDQVLNLFEITPDYDLDVMHPDQSLSDLTGTIITKLNKVMLDCNPDLVLVHGDTATTFAGALASYFNMIPVGHIEAGLRTNNIYSPWPEEANRKLTGVLAEHHFAPTEISKQNLLNEGIDSTKIIVTGNTVIDALHQIIYKIKDNEKINLSLKKKFNFLDFKKKTILITGHRRESFGDGFERICNAVSKLALKFSDVQFVYPVHLNPNVKDPVYKVLSNLSNVFLIEPLQYLPFVYLMDLSHIILTDSGGIQEEAPSLGKPVLVMRDFTERPEAVNAGTVKLVGTNENLIIENVTKLLLDENEYKKMNIAHNPYGDGKASQRIVKYLMDSI